MGANEKYFDHPGVVIAVASGDCGYDEGNDPEHWEFCRQMQWHYPSFPAKSPTVVAVGGTRLTQKAGFWTSTAWSQGGSGCTPIFPAPPWQIAVADWSATGCGGERLSVDVSANADPASGPRIYDSTPAPDWAHAGWGFAGGTSAAAPIVAGEFALAGGARGVAYPAETLYSHAADASALEDVVQGENGSCGGRSICEARIGYDGPSGLGSPIGLSAFSLPGAPEETRAPSLSGAAIAGRRLTAHRGAWLDAPSSFGYQWEVCAFADAGCLPIQGATGPRLMVGSTEIGKTIRVMETVGNSSGFGPPVFSAPSARARGGRGGHTRP